MFQKMNFLGLVVPNVAEATEFYTQKLGFAVDLPASIPNQFTQFKLAGETIFGLIAGFEQDGINQAFDTGLLAPDIEATYSTLKASGVEVLPLHDMPFGRTFFFRTPAGHVLRVYSPH
jgi:catechol 2,3-dioxygenase-like lactoylglutathione lyase family enzyme